jgi:hypothetical protein
MSDPVLNIGLAIPAYGAKVSMWHAEFWMSMGFGLATSEHRFRLRSFGYADTCGVDVARNRLVDEAIEKGCDWLFMLDADTWHEGNGAAYDILQMISDAARTPDCAFVGAPVPCRGPDKIVYSIYDRIPNIMDPSLYLGKQTLTEVDGLGAAICAININFLREKNMPPPWFKFDWIDGTMKYIGEDLYFCRKVQQYGGRVFVDGRFVGKHMQRPKVIEGVTPSEVVEKP